MTTHTISVGNVEITALSDGYIRFAPGGFFPSVPAERWEEYRGELTAEGKLELNVGSFLVRSEGRVILVDTGIGEDASGFEDAHSGLLPQALADLGVSAADVDVVLMTHLHVDHVGWNVATAESGPAPVFPNARYHVAAADWRAFARMARMNGAPYLQSQVLPLEELGVLELFEGEVALTSEVVTLPTPGHTPGHTSLRISSAGETAVIAGDATHLPLQAHETDWCPRADRDPKLSTQSRHVLMDRVESDGGLLIAGHYPAPGFGRLARRDGRRRWLPA